MDERRPWLRSWGFVIAGALVTPPCLMLVVVLAAGGHGSYLSAKLLFPVTMLSTLLTGHISESAIGLAILQFPIYGAVLGYANESETVTSRLVLLVASHALLAATCLLLLPERPF